jgi:putative ABC transport system substrate-binding protein
MTSNLPIGRGARWAAAFRSCVAGLLLCALGTACSPSAGTDDSGVKKIAYLRSVATPDSPVEEAITDELAKRGFELGRNLTVLGGAGDQAFPDPSKARAAVKEWQEQGVDVIIAYSTAGAEIARDDAPGANVLFLVNDPQAAGFVTDEQRPEGRMTGVTFRVPADRMLSLARRIIPGLQRIGLPYPPSDPAAVPSRDQFAQAARDQGMELIAEEFSDAADLPRAVTKLVTVDGADLLLASVSPTATRALPELANAAALYRIPFAANVGTAERALLTISPDSRSIGLQLGRQAARLLNGATPASVPVENPRRFNIGLSQKVAAELGITLPADVVREADVVRN